MTAPHHCPRCGYPGKDKRAKKGGAKRWAGVSAEERSRQTSAARRKGIENAKAKRLSTTGGRS